MRCLISTCQNPYFNLAAEEYFLKNSTEEIFMLYINEPCIVVGKHQNLLAEINLRFVNEQNIKLARRISGGGTVYQDPNNLNFSFIRNCKNLDQINFTRFTLPILESLINIGLKVKFSDRNDLIINNQKVSGNAMHIYKSRVLSHGTLLFNSNLNQLSGSLRNNSSNYTDKSIKSVKSEVANISNYLAAPKTIVEFTKDIFYHVVDHSKLLNPFLSPITSYEALLIEQVSKDKFATWDWIFGYSPKYIFKNNIKIFDLAIPFELSIERGIILTAHFHAEEKKYPIYSHAFKIIANTKHDFDAISQILNNDPLINSSVNFNLSEFCYNLF